MEKKLSELLVSGEELTLNYKTGKTSIQGKQTIFTKDQVEFLRDHGFIECDTGNFDTGEKHFVFNFGMLKHSKALTDAYDICFEFEILTGNVIGSGEASKDDRKWNRKSKSFIKFFKQALTP